MSEAVQIALIVAVPPTILALGSFVASILNRKKLDTIHVDMNGKLTALLDAHGLAEHAKGVAEGRQMGIDERKSRVTESERVEDRQDKRDLKTEAGQPPV